MSRKVLSEAEIKVLEKGLDYAPIQNKINEPELRKYFDVFCRRMPIKWHFRNEPTQDFSDKPAFSAKSTWNPPKGHPNIEVFLSQIEHELFQISDKCLHYSNLTKEEWLAVRSLADDRSIVTKKADKGSCIVVWDRVDYLLEAEKQLSDRSVYKNISFNKKLLTDLVESSNQIFHSLKRKGSITDKQLKYFLYNYKNATNLGKLYLLPKIHKRLSNVPGRPVICNCGNHTERASEFLDHHLKPVTQNGKSYIRDSIDFISKIKDLNNIPQGALIVTTDVVRLYPSIPLDFGLKSLGEVLEKRKLKPVSTDDLVRMAEFVLQNNSGTAIGTKSAPTYACIFMDQVEIQFLKTQPCKSLVWLRYIDDIFFICTHGKESLTKFLDDFNRFHLNLKFPHEFSEKSVTFLDLNVNLSNGSITTDLHIKLTDRHLYLHFLSAHPDHTKRSIVYSQALRISRVCSFEEDFKRYTTRMESWFLNRGYPSWLIKKEMEKVRNSHLNDRKRAQKPQGVPRVIPYHPLFKTFGNIIRKHLNLLYMNEEVKRVFTPCPMVSFRGARKLSSYLVRTKLYSLERSVLSFKCSKRRCQVCENVCETDTFKSSVTKEEYKINHKFNCNEKCLIYLLTCQTCLK